MNPFDHNHDRHDDDPFGPADEATWEPQPVCWARLDRDTALAAWHTLDAWVRWCVHRYGLDHRTVPPCWYLHGALVEELSALRTGWQAAHAPTAPGSAPLEWHNLFAAARQRLQDWVARTGCRPDEHRGQQRVAWVEEPDADFLTHITADLDRRGPANGQPGRDG